MDDVSATVVGVTSGQGYDAAQVLACAFERDPLIRYLLLAECQESSFPKRLEALFRSVVAGHLGHEWPIFGCLVNAQIIGVACVAEPVDGPPPQAVREIFARLASVIGPEATRRLQAYGQVTDQYRPAGPNHYLTVIGVQPDDQRRGCGRMLLDEVHTLSQTHRTSIGVALDTETPANVSLYKHFGYRVIARTSLEGVPMWHMFRPNGP